LRGCKKSGQRLGTVNFRFVGKTDDYPETGFGALLPRFLFGPDPFPPFLVRERSELLVVGWLEAGRLFEDIQESSRAIDSVALRITYPFDDTRTFQSFDGALRGRKRDRQFVRHSSCSDERICPQEFDYTQRIVA
jgi:hypothetical protein